MAGRGEFQLPAPNLFQRGGEEPDRCSLRRSHSVRACSPRRGRDGSARRPERRTGPEGPPPDRPARPTAPPDRRRSRPPPARAVRPKPPARPPPAATRGWRGARAFRWGSGAQPRAGRTDRRREPAGRSRPTAKPWRDCPTRPPAGSPCAPPPTASAPRVCPPPRDHGPAGLPRAARRPRPLGSRYPRGGAAPRPTARSRPAPAPPPCTVRAQAMIDGRAAT